VRYLYNVIDGNSPSYLTARDLVGFQDSNGGAKSPLCSGQEFSEILSQGFLNLPTRTSPGGNAGTTCIVKTP
jgi:hypothetical protein